MHVTHSHMHFQEIFLAEGEGFTDPVELHTVNWAVLYPSDHLRFGGNSRFHEFCTAKSGASTDVFWAKLIIIILDNQLGVFNV